jgi:hypothetical protein
VNASHLQWKSFFIFLPSREPQEKIKKIATKSRNRETKKAQAIRFQLFTVKIAIVNNFC